MINNAVVHFEIYVDDMSRARAFYQALLQINLTPLPNPTPDVPMEMWFFPMDAEQGSHSYGSGGSLVKMAGQQPGAGGTLVYFGCEDCAIPAGRAVAAGGELVQDKTAIGEHGFFALIRDSEGNLIGLHSMQ